MDGGDSNSGGLKIHHDNSQPTSTSPTGSGFESLETNTSTTSSSSPVAPVSSPTPTSAPTPIEVTSPNATETTTEAPIATPAATPVSTPPDVIAGPAPDTPLDTPISSSVAPSAPTPSTPTPGTGSATPGSFTTSGRFPTPQSRLVPPQQPAFPPAVSPVMSTGIMSSRFDTGESYASEPKSTGRGKKLAIVLVLLLLIVAIGVGIWWVLSKGSIGGSSAQDTRTLLNTYSNYLLYGVESNEPIESNLDVWDSDYIETQLANTDTEAQTAYFDKLIDMYDKFKTSYENDSSIKQDVEESQLRYTNNIIDNTSAALVGTKDYALIPKISTEEMIQMYFTEGGVNMVKAVSDTYADFASSDNLAKSDYGSAKIGTAEAIRILYTEYANLGCITGQTLSEQCVAANSSSEVVTTQQNTLREYTKLIDNAVWHFTNDILSVSLMTYEAINPTYYQEEVNSEN